jgi:hypothetical protein
MRTSRKRKSRILKGSYEDSGRYLKCHYCGFINDRERLSLPNSSGVNPHWVQIPDTEISCSGDPNKVIVANQTLEAAECAVLLATRNDGESKIDYYHPRLPRVVAGCAFCGCTNLP